MEATTPRWPLRAESVTFISPTDLDFRMASPSRAPSARNTASNRFFRAAGLALGLFAMFAVGSGRADAAGYFEGRHYPIVTDPTFTADELILDQARFWFAIYVEVGDDEGLLHDPFYPDLVFRKVSAPGQGRPASKLAEAHVRALQEEIRVMLAKDSSAWTPKERELRAEFPPFWDSTGITLSAQRIRFQRGLKGKYRAGLERSYRYLPLIDSVLAEQGVPSRLKYLTHVESSFYPFAYSKVGAAGMWQFMKSSARLYKMKVGYQVDERRDPHASTVAAARMLAGNYNYLKSWPLAIMAYNHGPNGVAKAVAASGTRDLGTIIKSYYSSSFGFASKNFYAEFLAASSIALKADSLFPDLRKMEPLRYRNLVLGKNLGIRYLCSVTGLSPEELEEYNLGLRPATFRGNGQLPKGFTLRLPMTVDLASVGSKLGGTELLPRAGSMETAVASASARPTQGTQADPTLVMAAPPSSPVTNVSPVTDTLSKAGKSGPAPADKSGGPDGNTLASAKAEASKRKGQDSKPEAAPGATVAAAAPAPVRAAGAPAPAKPIANGTAPVSTPSLRPAPSTEAEASQAPAKPVLAAAPQSDAVKAIAKSRDSASERARTAATTAPAQGVAAPGAIAQNASPAAPAAPAQTASAQAESPTAPAEQPADRVVDPTLALQAADMDKLAHPMDRFNPSIYNLDYTYGSGVLSIQAGTEETLSHYAEWAWVSESVLKRMNRIRGPRDFRMGRKIKIPLTEDKAKEFVKRREEYYRAIEEDFYGSYYVSTTEPFRVQKGMNLWNWAQEKEIPFWLLQKHNPGKALNELHPGDTLNMPVIETGNRRWGFTRYGNSKEYLSGISRFLSTGKREAY
jgi:membrane-bound lytic murein transglycosylase D